MVLSKLYKIAIMNMMLTLNEPIVIDTSTPIIVHKHIVVVLYCRLPIYIPQQVL